VAHGTIKFVFPVPLGIVKVAFAGTPGQPLPFGMLPIRRVHGNIPAGLTLVMGIDSCLSTEDQVCDNGPGGDDVMEREKYAPTEDWVRDDGPGGDDVMERAKYAPTEDWVCDENLGGDDVMEREKYAPTEDWVSGDGLGDGGRDRAITLLRSGTPPRHPWSSGDASTDDPYDPAALLFYAREDMNITGRIDGLLSTLDENGW